MDVLWSHIQRASLRPWLRYLFKQFGYHCATHQIRVILISCVVITSLLYPALALYAPSTPLSSLSSSLSNLFPTEGHTPHLRDLHEVWHSHEALHLRYDATAKARCGLERTVRIERILIANNRRHENGVLNKATLGLALDLQIEIASRLASSTDTLPCVKTSSGQCLFISPLSFWDNDPARLAVDEDIIGTLNRNQNITVSGFPVSLSMVVADRADMDDGDYVDIATFLVLTYFFIDEDCHTQGGHNAWTQLVSSVMQGRGQVDPIVAQPKLLAIQFDADHSRVSLISILLYVTYLVVFIHFSGSLRRMNTVHSRFGIAFTGIVEIIASTITSVSVCALWGFRVTMVPWGILPIVIVFVGAENMFRLVDDVVSTPISLPVKERIARGLSEAGASNTLKVVTYNAALGIIAVFAPGAIHQFCVFALVVLVAHWFLVHTFFVAVLSIDLQRLELYELLHQDQTMHPDVKESLRSGPPSPLDSKSPKETSGWLHRFLHGSAARNGSLIMMLAVTGVLYLVTSSAVPPGKKAMYTLDRVVALRKAGTQSPSWQLWQTLNSVDDPLVHIRMEAPTLILFDRYPGTDEGKEFHDRHITTRLSRGSRHFIKIFVIPIASTTGLLWMLLIYLLKDAEEREAQENETNEKRKRHFLDEGFGFTTIPRACQADIERLDATPDGSTIISVSMDNEVAIWCKRYGTFFTLPRPKVDQPNSVVTAIAMDSVGVFCAVGMRSGSIILYRLESGIVAEQRTLVHPLGQSRVIELAFEDKPAQRGNRPSMLHRRSLDGDTRTTEGYLLATFKDGSVVEWNDLFDPEPEAVRDGTKEQARVMLLRPGSQESLSFALVTAEGGVHFCTRSGRGWERHATCPGGSPEDPIVKVHAQAINIDLKPHTVLVTATQSGHVAIWDAGTGERWFALEDPLEDINRLRLAPVPMKPCPSCTKYLPDIFTLTISSGTIASIHRFVVQDATRCSCPLPQPPPPPTNLLRSRQGSFTTPVPLSRSKPSALSASGTNLSNLNDFPVSGHGVHSRRGSEKDPPRRPESGFYLFEDGNAQQRDSCEGSFPILYHTRLADISFQEGAWDTINHVIYGLRRGAELGTLDEDDESLQYEHVDWTSNYEGLEHPVLERWKLWVFDPTSIDCCVRESTLAMLASKPIEVQDSVEPVNGNLHNRSLKSSAFSQPEPRQHSSQSYSEPSSYPRLPFTEVSSLTSLSRGSCLVALGNTIGLVTFAPDNLRAVARGFHIRTASSLSNIGSSTLKKRM